ncbi:Brassinosteroid-responsive RING protein 1 [Sesamum alatum]|uniref:Brassinosteroid-responsive RING protein 1 n=1 Tax=Sesamum alatum TaxID=300844 RepID=A0AAE1Y4W8_9LAMI|nr:Brassinosteroid-responsive RING protein 1 [Sesamum alatum]
MEVALASREKEKSRFNVFVKGRIHVMPGRFSTEAVAFICILPSTPRLTPLLAATYILEKLHRRHSSAPFRRPPPSPIMGILYHAIRIPKAITITFFLNILTHARFLFIGALTHLGLFKPPPEENPNSRDNYILILDPSSPSLVPIPIHVATAAIKNRVPIVRYRDLLLRREREEKGPCGQSVCSICLECVEGSDEIRELINCRHLFHRACLDTWIDQGEVNCPLCRSMLLPPKLSLFRCCNENGDGVLGSNNTT